MNTFRVTLRPWPTVAFGPLTPLTEFINVRSVRTIAHFFPTTSNEHKLFIACALNEDPHSGIGWHTVPPHRTHPQAGRRECNQPSLRWVCKPLQAWFLDGTGADLWDLESSHPNLFLCAVNGTEDRTVAPHLFDATAPSSKAQFRETIVQYYADLANNSNDGTTPPRHIPSPEQVKILLTSFGMGQGFKAWHEKTLHNTPPHPTREAPTAIGYQREVRGIQQAIVAAFPDFVPHDRPESWQGQGAARGSALWAQTLEDNCVTLATNAAAGFNLVAGMFAGDSLTTFPSPALPPTQTPRADIAQSMSARVMLELGLAVRFVHKPLPPKADLASIPGLFAARAPHPPPPLADFPAAKRSRPSNTAKSPKGSPGARPTPSAPTSEVLSFHGTMLDLQPMVTDLGLHVHWADSTSGWNIHLSLRLNPHSHTLTISGEPAHVLNWTHKIGARIRLLASSPLTTTFPPPIGALATPCTHCGGWMPSGRPHHCPWGAAMPSHAPFEVCVVCKGKIATRFPTALSAHRAHCKAAFPTAWQPTAVSRSSDQAESGSEGAPFPLNTTALEEPPRPCLAPVTQALKDRPSQVATHDPYTTCPRGGAPSSPRVTAPQSRGDAFSATSASMDAAGGDYGARRSCASPTVISPEHKLPPPPLSRALTIAISPVSPQVPLGANHVVAQPPGALTSAPTTDFRSELEAPRESLQLVPGGNIPPTHLGALH